MTTTTAKSTTELRAEYKNAIAGLAYDNASRADVKAALAAVVPAGSTPAKWVLVATTLRMPCRRCMGTGKYVTGTMNGQPVCGGGPCYRCDGRGTQGADDGHRNHAFDKHYMAQAARAMFG